MARKSRKNISEASATEEKGSAQQASGWPAAIYARLSIENSGKDDDGESIEGQIEICRDYVEEHPYLHYMDTYVDNGWTGTNTNRPEFQRLIDDITRGRIKALVIKDFSRFSRDYIEAGNLLENVFPSLGVRFISVADRYDSFETDGSASSLLIPLKNLINSYYSKDISRKVSSAVHARQAAGEYIPGRVPYGYVKSTARVHRLEPDPETSATVARIFQMRVDGTPVNRIASILQAEGIPSPGRLRYLRGEVASEKYAASKWSPTMVRHILGNPTYLGNLVFGRTVTALYLGLPHYRIENDEGKWRVLEDMHEPLVTQEMFGRAKEMAECGRAKRDGQLSRSAEERIRNAPLFQGILFCGDCGAHMVYHRYYGSGKPDGIYSCSGYSHGKCRHTHSFRKGRLEEAVWLAVRDQLSLCCDYEAVVKKLQNGGTTVMIEEYRTEMQSLSLRLASRREKRERLYEDFTDGILSPEEYMAMKKKYDEEYREASARLVDTQSRMARLKKSLSGDNRWLQAIKKFSGAEDFSKDAVEALAEKILIYQNGGEKRIEIRFRYAADRELLENAVKEKEGGEAE